MKRESASGGKEKGEWGWFFFSSSDLAGAFPIEDDLSRLSKGETGERSPIPDSARMYLGGRDVASGDLPRLSQVDQANKAEEAKKGAADDKGLLTIRGC